MLRNTLGTGEGEHSGNLMGTHWEQQSPILNPSPKGTRVPWVHAASPHWLHKCCLSKQKEPESLGCMLPHLIGCTNVAYPTKRNLCPLGACCLTSLAARSRNICYKIFFFAFGFPGPLGACCLTSLAARSRNICYKIFFCLRFSKSTIEESLFYLFFLLPYCFY